MFIMFVIIVERGQFVQRKNHKFRVGRRATNDGAPLFNRDPTGERNHRAPLSGRG
jgi:hypothetical protein